MIRAVFISVSLVYNVKILSIFLLDYRNTFKTCVNLNKAFWYRWSTSAPEYKNDASLIFSKPFINLNIYIFYGVFMVNEAESQDFYNMNWGNTLENSANHLCGLGNSHLYETLWYMFIFTCHPYLSAWHFMKRPFSLKLSSFLGSLFLTVTFGFIPLVREPGFE